MGYPSLLLSAFLWLVLNFILGIRVKRLTFGVWGKWRLVLDGLELPRWLLRLLVPRTFQGLEVESAKIQSIKVVVPWRRLAFASSSSSSSKVVFEVKGLHITLLASSISDNDTHHKGSRASSFPFQRKRGFQPPKTSAQQTGFLPQWLTNHLQVGLADVSVRLVGPRDTLVASLGSFCLAPADGGRAIKLELLHVAFSLLLQGQHGTTVLPVLSDAGMMCTLELAGGKPSSVDFRLGSGKEGLLDQPIEVHMDACRRRALVEAWRCLDRKREVAESPSLNTDTPVQGDELFWDACASAPISLPVPAGVAFFSPGTKVVLGLDAEEVNDGVDATALHAQLGALTFEMVEQNVVASLASAGAMLVEHGDQLPLSPLLQIPRIDFDGSVVSTFTRPCSWRLRAGVFSASWSSTLMHRLVQFFEPPVSTLPAPLLPARATLSTASAQATTDAFISGGTTDVADGVSGILASFLSQRLGKHLDLVGAIEAAEGQGMPVPSLSAPLLPRPLTPTLPLIVVDVEGVQLVLPPLVASTSSPPLCTPKALTMALGRLTVQTGGTTAVVKLARVGVAVGHIQLLNLGETLMEASPGAARATLGHTPPERTWPPQDAEEWREAKAALWDLHVTLPELRASLELDHVMEAIWLATKSTPRREGATTSGPPTQSRRQAYILPSDRAAVKLPLLCLQMKCPTVDFVLLPGTRHEGLPAVGPSVLEGSMPWYAPDDSRRSDPLLFVRLSQGMTATYALGNGCLTPASFVARVEVPMLQVFSSASTGDSLGARQVVLLDLKALEWSLSSFPTHCHWAPAPGPWGAHFWIGVAEQSHKQTVAAQYVEVGLEPSLIGRLSHLAQALKHVPIIARGVQGPVAVSTSAPCGVPFAPLLTLTVLFPAQTRVKLYWTESTGTATVAELVLTETRVSLSAGVVGGRLTLGGSIQDFDIVDGSPGAPELQKVLCRLRTEPQSQQHQQSATPKMLTFQFEERSGWPVGDGPRLLLQASDWRFVYLQRVTMELVGYFKDWLIPSFGRAASVRPQDVLSGSVVHLLATLARVSIVTKATPWIQGIPKSKPTSTAATSKPSPSPARAFRLQVLLVNSRALLANSSDIPDGLIVAFERYRLWRAPNTEREDAYWQGPELVSSSRGCGSTMGGANDGPSSSTTTTNPTGGGFHDPLNDPRDMLAVVLAELSDLVCSAELLAAESSRLVEALAAKQAALNALQAQLPLGGPCAQLAAQRAIVDELEQRLASRRVVKAQVTAHKQLLEQEVVRWGKCVAATAPTIKVEAPGHPRWQHGQDLPSKPANRLDMDLEGATISTWKAGVVGKDIRIHGYIEAGRLSFPFGNPPGVYPEVYKLLGWQRYIGWDTNNTAVVVALFVHELEWVLSRSQYSSLLALLMENTREPCLFVPVLHPLPPPPVFEEIETGPACITVPPSVSVSVYFKHATVRLVEDVIQCGSDAAVGGGPAPLAGWSEEDEEEELEEEEEEEKDEDQGTAGGGRDVAQVEDEGEGAMPREKQAAASLIVIALEEIQGKTGMEPPSFQHDNDSFLCSRLLPGMPQRSGWLQIPCSAYVATVTLTMAILSIDRRPENKGLELSVTAEVISIENEEVFLFNNSSTAASQLQVEGALRPSKILFPSSNLLQGGFQRGTDGSRVHDAGDSTMPRLPEHLQARYTQQSLACYRRCVVELGRSVVVGAGDRLLRVVDFFVQPVQKHNAQGPPLDCEQAKNLDVIVSIEDSLLCLQESCKQTFSPALFMHVQCDYTQKWRGFVEGGPGTVDATVDVGLQNVFFSRQGLVLGRCLPLASPVSFHLGMLTDILRRHNGPPDRHRSLIFKTRTLKQHICTRSNGFSFRTRRRGGNDGGDLILMGAPLSLLGTPVPAVFPSSSSSAASEQVHFFLSVPDFRLSLKVARNFARELDGGRQHIRTLELGRANAVLAAATRMVPATDATLSLAAIPEHLVEEETVAPADGAALRVPTSTTQIFVSLDDLRFTLVNNSLGVPIAYAALLSTDFRLQQQEDLQSIDMEASVGLRAGYFNHRTYEWEPILETTALSAETTRKVNDADIATDSAKPKDDGQTLQIQLSVLEPCNINVTHALLSLAQNEALVTDLLAKRSSRSAPYLVRNRTGEKVQVHFLRNHSTAHTCTLTENQDVPFDFRDVGATMLFQPSCSDVMGATERISKPADFLHSLSLHVMTREGSGPGFKSTGALPMDIVGLYDARLKDGEPLTKWPIGDPLPLPSSSPTSPPPEESQAPALITEVKLQADGSKVVTLRSRCTIENSSGAPLHLLVTSPAAAKRASSSEEVVLQPDEKFYVPVSRLGFDTSFFVRTSPTLGWAPIFGNVGEMDGFMAEAADGAASLVCECPPLAPDAPIVPNDDCDDLVLAGSCFVGVEVRGEDMRVNAGDGLGIDGGAHAWDRPFSSNSPIPTVNSQADVFGDNDGEDEDYEVAEEKDAEVGKNELSAVGGQTLCIKRYDASASTLTVRNLAASIRRSTSGVGTARTSLLRSGSSLSPSTAAEGKGSCHRVPTQGVEAMPASPPISSSSPWQPRTTRILLRPVFVLHNLYPCSLLYRLCDKNGFVSAEGVLPVGASLPLFRMPIQTKQYLSVRLINYLWSTFTRVHSPKTPYPVQETVASMEMKSLHKMKGASRGSSGSSDSNARQAMFPATFDLPTQIVNVSLVGRHIRLYAKLAVVNRSSVLLDYKDGSMAADVNLTASSTSYFRHAPLPVTTGSYSTPASTGLGSPTVVVPDAAPTSATFSPRSPLPHKPLIVSVALRLASNHFNTVKLQVPDSGNLIDLFLIAADQVHTMRGAVVEDFEFALDTTPEELDRVQLCVSSSPSSSPIIFAGPRNPFISSSSSLRQPSSLSAPASLAEQLHQGLKSALGSNRSNLYEPDKAHLLCFLTGPVHDLLDKRATLSSLAAGGMLALRLMHRAEIDLASQVAQTSTVIQYQHLAFPGVPFSPPAVFGHGVQLALRCCDSEWSGPLDAPNLTMGSKVYSYLTLKRQATAGASQYDLGLVMTPCESPYHRTTVITIVPRYILANRLEVPLEFSQVGARLGVLQPGEEIPFHWPSSSVKKYLQVRIASSTAENVGQWSGDFPIDAVGELHVKLRKAGGSHSNDKCTVILRVNIELVQGSVVVAFGVQDPQWPPYIVENLTSYTLRYRQAAASLLAGLGAAVAEYDYLAPYASAAYAWDAPTSAVKVLQLEFQQGSRWEKREYGLDELKRHNCVKLSRALPDLTSPLFEGYLDLLRSSESWERVFGVLKGSALYVFTNAQKLHLRAIVNLNAGATRSGTTGGKSGKQPSIQIHKPTVTDVYSIFKANFDRATDKLNTLLLTTEETGSGRPQQSDHDGTEQLLGRIAYHVARFLASSSPAAEVKDRKEQGEEEEEEGDYDDAASDVAVIASLSRHSSTALPTAHSSRMPPSLPSSFALLGMGKTSTRVLTLPGRDWPAVMMEAGYGRDPTVAQRLALEIFSAGLLIPLSSIRSPLRRRSSLVDHEGTGIDARDQTLGRSLLQPRPPPGPPPSQQHGGGTSKKSAFGGNTSSSSTSSSSSSTSSSSNSIRSGSTKRSSYIPAKHNKGPAGRRQSTTTTHDSFASTDGTLYMLVAPQRDNDLAPSQEPAFEVLTAYGDKSVFRCRSYLEMETWVVALRDQVDRLVIATAPSIASFLQQQGEGGKGGNAGTSSGVINERPTSSSTPSVKAKTSVRVNVRADGPTKVLELIEEHDADADEGDEEGLARRSTRRWDQGLAGANNETSGGGGGGLPPRLFQRTSVNVFVRRVGISVVDEKPQETLYGSLDHINLLADVTAEHLTVSLTVEGLQLDNQLENAGGYAVVLAPRAIPLLTKREGHLDGQQQQPHLVLAGLAPRPLESAPAFHFYTRKIHLSSRDVLFFEAFSMWLRPLDVKLEESVVTSIVHLKNSIRLQHLSASLRERNRDATEHASAKQQLQQLQRQSHQQAPEHLVVLPLLPADLDGNDAAEMLGLAGSARRTAGRQWLLSERELRALHKPRAELSAGDDGKKLYFGVLHLHPISFDISFKYLALQESKDEDKDVVALSHMAQFDSARVRLNSLLVTDAFGSQEFVASTILRHYNRAVLQQIHTLLGSLDFIGNPVGFVNNLGTGVRDFFYEPWEGAANGSLEAFLGGVGKGTNSLVQRTLHGASGSAAKLTGTLGQGLASLAMDSKYKQDRTRRKAQEAKTVSQGFSQGSRELGRGLYLGLSGVIMAPVKGAERNGIRGFGAGMAKGLVGMAVKPAVGLIDFASRASEGLENFFLVTDMLQDTARGHEGRIRPPRSLGLRGEVKEYNVDEANALHSLRTVLSGCYKKEHIWFHFSFPGSLACLSDLELPETKLLRAFKEELIETARSEGMATPSAYLDLTPLFEATLVDQLIEEQVSRLSLIFSESRLLLVGEGEELVWEAPLETLVDVTAVSLTAHQAIRFTLRVPVTLAQSSSSTHSPFSTATGAFSKTTTKKPGTRRLPVIYHPGLQLEYWFQALLEGAMVARFAALQRLSPPEDSCIARGALERRRSGSSTTTTTGGGFLSGGGGSHGQRYWYTLNGQSLYEYKAPLQRPGNLHMVVPLAGLRVSRPSERTLRLVHVREGEWLTTFKVHHTSAASEGSLGDANPPLSITSQGLSESKREEIILVAPDVTTTQQWFALLKYSIVDDDVSITPKSPQTQSRKKTNAITLERRVLHLTERLRSGAGGGGGGAGGGSDGRVINESVPGSGRSGTGVGGGNDGGAAGQVCERSTTPSARRAGSGLNRTRLLYVPFDPTVKLEDVETIVRRIVAQTGLSTGANVNV